MPIFTGIIAGVVKLFLGIGGPGLVGQVLTHLEKRADNETERERIRSLQQTTVAGYGRDVIVSGMQHKAFWIPWLMATVPLSAWFAYGMLDTLFNGALPDTAKIPVGLLPWATVVWNNVFYTGAAGLAAESISAAAATIARRK